MIEFIECPECDMVFENGPSNYINLEQGNFCYKCGAKLTEGVKYLSIEDFIEYTRE